MSFTSLFETLRLVFLHMFDLSTLRMSDEEILTDEPIRILDHLIRQLQCRKVDQVKV
jgi:hypothetical protein